MLGNGGRQYRTRAHGSWRLAPRPCAAGHAAAQQRSHGVFCTCARGAFPCLTARATGRGRAAAARALHNSRCFCPGKGLGHFGMWLMRNRRWCARMRRWSCRALPLTVCALCLTHIAIALVHWQGAICRYSVHTHDTACVDMPAAAAAACCGRTMQNGVMQQRVLVPHAWSACTHCKGMARVAGALSSQEPGAKWCPGIMVTIITFPDASALLPPASQ